MNTAQQFDPRKLDPNKNLSDDERMALQLQEEQRIGDENEAKGLNRDGSAKAPEVKAPEAPAPAPVVEAPVDTDLGRGVRDNPAQDTSLSTEALAVKAILAKESRLPIFIPLEVGEPKGSYRSVTINGYRCEVMKGVMVQVPESIHSLIMNSMETTALATDVDENLDRANQAKLDALQ